MKSGILGTDGTRMCGGIFKEEIFRVTGCYVTLSSTSKATVPLTVNVWTNLDREAYDESFGIDNVVISRAKKGIASESDGREYYVCMCVCRVYVCMSCVCVCDGSNFSRALVCVCHIHTYINHTHRLGCHVICQTRRGIV